MAGIIEGIMRVLGTQELVCLSLDIDVLDLSFAPRMGTLEPSQDMTRELILILIGVEGLSLVGADAAEVAPAGVQAIYEILGLMEEDNDGRKRRRISKDRMSCAGVVE
jgi:arginase family enzyme